MSSSYEKAKFKIEADTGETSEWDVLFNPAQFAISKSARYTEDNTVDTKASSGGSDSDQKNSSNTKNYVGTSDASLSLELFLDTTVMHYIDEPENKAEPEDVSERVNDLMDLCIASDGQHRPPKVHFIWGSTHFIGYVHSVSATYLLFDKGGKPLRARVNLTISESERPELKSKKAKSSPDRTKARTVRDDADIFNIANREYNDPNMWKLICQANNISNPLDIAAGTVLRVPALD